MPFVALMLVAAVFAELYVIVQVAQAFGILATVVALVLIGAAGVWVVKLQGIAALRRVTGAVRQGKLPHLEVIDGASVLSAGLLLVVPGFISDVIALLVLLPPVRSVVRAWIVGRFAVVRVVDQASGRFSFGGQRSTGTDEVWDADSWEAD